MRREELTGLLWRDVDLEGGRLAVRRSRVMVGGKPLEAKPLTKTDSGRREVALAPNTVEALKAHAARQGEEAKAWGETWTDSGHVFTQENGEPLHPAFVTREVGQNRQAPRTAAPRPSRLASHDGHPGA